MKILIADPHPEVQSALRLTAGRLPGVTAVSAAGSLVQLLAQCAQACPDLILFDLNLVHPTRSQPETLADLIRVLRRLCPGGKLIAMSSRLEADAEALAAGADGFISKTDLPDEVFAGLAGYLENRS